MSTLTRRKFLELAGSFAAVLAWPLPRARASRTSWQERRDCYPQGVASADPHPNSVILWTRRPPARNNTAAKLTVEISDREDFHRVVATSTTNLSPENDWTCRILAAGLKPGQIYWYRFTDEHGCGSRVGRTATAPANTDPRPARFAFVSCQNVQQGASLAYRRMIWEDQHKPLIDQLQFVLHLGDFVYEIVWYPEDRPQGMHARRLRDLVRYEHGEKIRDFHVPTTVDDYRALYRGYLSDPDLQNARARWPFICMWDNHEFSWKGWQSQQNFSGVRAAQTRKVAANQAWFEYQPARVVKAQSLAGDRYRPPAVIDKPIQDFDDHGLGQEEGNLAAINSLRVYRAFRWGRNVDLILTDNRSFRSEPVIDSAAFEQFQPTQFPYAVAQDVLETLDAGREYNGGRAPKTIRFNGRDLPNPRRTQPSGSMLGAAQKQWLLERLLESRATWKLWGNSVAMLDLRLDFQNLPAEVGARWPASGFALVGPDDWSGYRAERSEILDLLRRRGITGMVSIAGDRHSFQAGVVSASLPPKQFNPVAVEFVTGSVSAPGLFEAAEYSLPKDHPLRSIYLYAPANESRVQAAINLSLMQGVRASLAWQKSGDQQRALAERNVEVAPHLSFVDVGGHGYATVTARPAELEVEFVCIPRPVEKNELADGGPLVYRVVHRVKRWNSRASPRLERTVKEGMVPFGSDSLS